MEPLPNLDDDGLQVGEVGGWAERKYRLVAYYADQFATAMKRKWASRAYIDLFAGSGRGRIKGTRRVIATSPTLALDVRDPFDRYVFCDIDPACITALRERVTAAHPERDVRYLTGDANALVEEIVREVRTGGSQLSFCVVDPYKLANLRFATIERLASIFVDFLVLIPSFMDAHRNERPYVAEGSRTVADFLGNPGWRSAWSEASGDFGGFIVDQFGQSMKRLGFIYDGPGNEVPILLPERNVKLYHLAFYSKHPLGMKFWQNARARTHPQLDLSFD